MTTSPRACILDPDENLQAFIPVIECTWEHQEAVLMFEPDDATDGRRICAKGALPVGVVQDDGSRRGGRLILEAERAAENCLET